MNPHTNSTLILSVIVLVLSASKAFSLHDSTLEKCIEGEWLNTRFINLLQKTQSITKSCGKLGGQIDKSAIVVECSNDTVFVSIVGGLHDGIPFTAHLYKQTQKQIQFELRQDTTFYGEYLIYDRINKILSYKRSHRTIVFKKLESDITTNSNAFENFVKKAILCGKYRGLKNEVHFFENGEISINDFCGKYRIIADCSYTDDLVEIDIHGKTAIYAFERNGKDLVVWSTKGEEFDFNRNEPTYYLMWHSKN